MKMKFVWCPPGKFTMGSPESELGRGSDEDQVNVTLSKGFWIGKTEVTQSQWQELMGTSPWEGKDLGEYWGQLRGDMYKVAETL